MSTNRAEYRVMIEKALSTDLTPSAIVSILAEVIEAHANQYIADGKGHESSHPVAMYRQEAALCRTTARKLRDIVDNYHWQ